MKKKVAKKKVVVDSKFFLSLADQIYCPKTKRFLRLCTGKLCNGPDPTNRERPMHCGLGELYFAMTGEQPEQGLVDESTVVDLAVKLSGISSLALKRHASALKDAIAKLKKLDISPRFLDLAIESLEDIDEEDDDHAGLEAEFRQILDDIPEVNDGVHPKDEDAEADSVNNYRRRARLVAEKFKEAAKLLNS